jgi:hypothetical protein
MREIRSRSAYDIKRSSAYEGPYKSPKHVSDYIILAIFIITLVCLFLGVFK